MPLTASGKDVLSSMTAQYGDEKGRRVFYGSISKGKPGSTKWHGPSRPVTRPTGGRTLSKR